MTDEQSAQATSLTAEQKLQKIREIIESSPVGPPRLDPNKERGPLTTDFFSTKPGFWEEYFKVGR
jgi:hypothetical protein